MLRIVPRGLVAGDRIKLLAPATMTNALVFPADVEAEVRVVYPGGVVVRAEGVPGGLVPSGTPAHRIGDPEPTPEEIMRCVAGYEGKSRDPEIPRSAGKPPRIPYAAPVERSLESWAEAAPDRGKSTGRCDYEFDLERPVSGKGQVAKLMLLFKAHGKPRLLDSEVRDVLAGQKEFLKTRQEPYRIFTYYRKALEEAGFLKRKSPEPSKAESGESNTLEASPSEKDGSEDVPF